MSVPEQFTGYAVSMNSYQTKGRTSNANQSFSSCKQAFEQQKDVFDLKPYSYTPRPFTEKDIDIKILASGICGR